MLDDNAATTLRLSQPFGSGTTTLNRRLAASEDAVGPLQLAERGGGVARDPDAAVDRLDGEVFELDVVGQAQDERHHQPVLVAVDDRQERRPAGGELHRQPGAARPLVDVDGAGVRHVTEETVGDLSLIHI